MHLFCGAVDVGAYVENVHESKTIESSPRSNMAELTQRVSDLEAELAEIKQQLGL